MRKTYRLLSLRRSASAIAVATALVSAQSAFSAEIVVGSGTTDTTGQFPADGDTLTVEKGGTISVSGNGVDAVVAAPGAHVSIFNHGVIEAAGPGTAMGIVGDFKLEDFLNTGSITGFYSGMYVGFSTTASFVNEGWIAGDQSGLTFAMSNIADFANSGTIQGEQYGIKANGSTFQNLTNSGTIRGKMNQGIYASSIGTLTNTGTGKILGDGLLAGIEVTNGIGTIFNEGEISGYVAGILVAGSSPDLVVNGRTGEIAGVSSGIAGTILDINNLRNDGTILATGNAGNGIAADNVYYLVNSGTIAGGNDAIAANYIHTVVNSGTIGQNGGYALEEMGAGDTTLNLQAGSVLIGNIIIGQGNDTLIVGPGLNLALDFGAAGDVPETILTAGAPYYVDAATGTVYVADVSAFSEALYAPADLISALGGVVAGALNPAFDEKGFNGDRRYWVEGIGGGGRGASDDATGYFGGMVAGLGADIDDRTKAGFFLGATTGRVETSAGDVTTDSFYAGLYGARQFEDFRLEVALTAGYGQSEESRTINDNLAVDGLVHAHSAWNSFFLSPSATFRKPFIVNDMAAEGSLRLAYTGIFSQGFTETGTAAPLTVDGATAHVFETRALLSLPREAAAGSGTLKYDLHTGLEGRAAVNPADISGSFGGSAITVSAASSDLTAGVVAGAGFDYRLAGGARLFGGVDTVVRSNSGVGLTGSFGVKGTF